MDLALDLDVEEVELPVTSDLLTLRTKQDRGVVELLFSVDGFEDAAGSYIDPVGASLGCEAAQGRTRNGFRVVDLR